MLDFGQGCCLGGAWGGGWLGGAFAVGEFAAVPGFFGVCLAGEYGALGEATEAAGEVVDLAASFDYGEMFDPDLFAAAVGAGFAGAV